MRDFTGTPEEQAKAIAAISDAVCRTERNMEWLERKESLEMDVKECEIIIMKRTTDLRYAELKLKEVVDELKEHLESAPQ